MDILRAIVQIQTALGAGIEGQYGSLAARLAQFIPGSGGIPNVLSFVNQLSVLLHGSVHQQHTGALLYQVWDAQTPRQAVAPASVTIDQSNYDVNIAFASAQSGNVLLAAPSPLYVTRFTGALTLTIPAAAHNLPANPLFFQVYDDSLPAHAIEAGPLTIDAAGNVVLYFAAPQSGLLILSTGGPRFEYTYTNASAFTITQAQHGLGSAALLYQLYDDGSPRVAIQPESVTVHPTTFEVIVRFQSGTLNSGMFILTSVAAISGQEFEMRDTGILGQSATRVYSENGTLNLMGGAGDRVYVRNRIGVAAATFDVINGRLGLGGGLVNPTFQLQLAVDSAAKPGTSTWQVSSDSRLKEAQSFRRFTDGLDVLMQLEPLWFRYNGLGGIPASTTPQIGLLADALKAIAPYMVGSYRGKLRQDDPEETDILTYNGHAMTFVLINAIQALVQRVEALEQTCAALGAQRTVDPTEEPTA